MNLKTIIILGGLLILFSACTSKEQDAENYLKRGKKFYDAGEMQKARLDFLNAKKLQPQSSEPYYYLGLIAKHEGEVTVMLRNMLLAEKVDPQHFDAKWHLAEIYLLSKNYQEAFAKAEEALILKPNDIEARNVFISALIGLEKYDEANQLISDHLLVQTNDEKLMGLKAVIADRTGDLDTALSILDNVIVTAQDKTPHVIMRLDIYQRIGDRQGIEDNLKILADLLPEQEKFTLLLAQLLSDQGRSAEAEKYLTTLVNRQPENQSAKVALIDSVLIQDRQRGMTLLEQEVKQYPEHLEIRFFHIKQLFIEKQSERALAILQSLTEDNSFSLDDNIRARAVLAEVYFSQNQEQEALALVEKNLSLDRQHEHSLILQAKYEVNNKIYDDAISTLRILLRSNPDSEEGLLLLGYTFLETGSELLADDQFRQALKLNPYNVEAVVPVVERLLKVRDLERAEQTVIRALAKNSKEPRLLASLAQIKVMRQDWQGSDEIVTNMQALGTDKTYIDFIRGQIAQGQKKYTEAITKYREVLLARPNFIPALQGIASCYTALHQSKDLLAFLEEFQRKHPQNTMSYLLASQVYLNSQNPSASKQSLSDGLREDPHWIVGYQRLATIEERLGKTDAAIAALRDGMEKNGNTLLLSVPLATLYVRAGKYDEAQALYEKVLTQQPDNLLVVNNYLVLLVDQLGDAEALTRAKSLVDVLSNTEEPAFIDTYGWALVNLNDYVAGEAALRLAAESLPDIAEVRFHFGVALLRLNRMAEGERELKQARTVALADGQLELLAKIDKELNAL